MNTELYYFRLKLQEIDWSRIECINCGNPIYLTGISVAMWFHKRNAQSDCGGGCGLRATPDLDKAVRDIDAEPHQTGCVCADCSGAELTSDND